MTVIYVFLCLLLEGLSPVSCDGQIFVMEAISAFSLLLYVCIEAGQQSFARCKNKSRNRTDWGSFLCELAIVKSG